MPWIETIREDEWAGELAGLYERVADKTAGRVDNIMQIHSLNPRARQRRGPRLCARAGLSEKRLAMLEYAEKLTLTPGEMAESDVLALEAAGFTPRDVLDIAEVIAYYAYVNRIADGLGVAVETWLAAEE